MAILKTIRRYLGYGVLGLVITSCTVVETGEVGVVERLGKVKDTPLPSGLHSVNPFTTDIISFSTRLKDVKETIEVTSKEGLRFNIDVSVQYRLNPGDAPKVYEEIGTDERTILISRFRSIVRGVTANYNTSAVYSTQRQAVVADIRSKLEESISPLGFRIQEVLLREVILPEQLSGAIEEKLAAEQESKKQKFLLEQERQEAQRKKVRAEGIAEFQKIIAAGTTEDFLEWKAIEATENLVTKLADSPNTKLIIVGGGENGIPAILQPSSKQQQQQ